VAGIGLTGCPDASLARGSSAALAAIAAEAAAPPPTMNGIENVRAIDPAEFSTSATAET
jgi:hypothetical protein